MRPVTVLVSLSLSLALLVPTATASAEDHADGRPDRASVLVSDVVADGLVVSGLAADKPVLGLLGLGVYLAGAPIVHGAKGHRDRAVLSVGVRVAAPTLLGYLGCKLIGDRSNHSHSFIPNRFGCALGLGIGVLAGGAGAEVVDWLFISTPDRGVAPSSRMFLLSGSF